MINIAHRGNINGPNEKFENEPKYLLEAFEEGYDLEIDIWYFKDEDVVFFGHDPENTHMIGKADDLNVMMMNDFDHEPEKIWFHAKNPMAVRLLAEMQDSHWQDLTYFMHDKDPFTFTNNGWIWGFADPVEGTDYTSSVIVMPEWHRELGSPLACYGVCSDYPDKWDSK